MFRTRTTVYLHYTIENNSGRPYRVNTPEAYLLQTDAPSISVSSLVRTQLNQAVFEELPPDVTLYEVFFFHKWSGQCAWLMRRAFPRTFNREKVRKELLPYGRS